MVIPFILINLQLFGDGAVDGAAAGGNTAVVNTASPGESNAPAVDAEQQREQKLRELGVPEDKIRKRAKSNSAPAAIQPSTAAQGKQDAAAAKPDEKTGSHDSIPDTAAKRMSWDEIKADPEYNKEIQSIVQARVRTAKSSEDALAKLTPAIEVLARKYKLDPANIDYTALSKAVNDDSDYYENRALEMGVPVDTAKKIDQQERDNARRQREEAKTIEQQKIENHILKLQQQGEQLKTVFTNFNLRSELQNPVFARLTSPGVGLSVEDAYYAVHRKDIQSAAMQATAAKTAEKLSNSIQSGQRRPSENGTAGQAPSVSTFDYRNASQAQREALKQRIRMAAARGEKLFPGQ